MEQSCRKYNPGGFLFQISYNKECLLRGLSQNQASKDSEPRCFFIVSHFPYMGSQSCLSTVSTGESQSIPFFWDRQTAREYRCSSDRFVHRTALQATLKQRRRHCHIDECASSTLDKRNKIATSCARYNLLLQESSSPEAVVSQRHHHQGRNSIGKYIS